MQTIKDQIIVLNDHLNNGLTPRLVALRWTSDDTIILDHIDDNRNIISRLFEVPVNTIHVKGKPPRLNITANDVLYHLDFAFDYNVQTARLGGGSDIYFVDGKASNTGVLRWVSNFAKAGAKVKYFAWQQALILFGILFGVALLLRAIASAIFGWL